MKLSDDAWKSLKGLFGKLYDPRAALQKIENGRDTSVAWSELWEGLHHQGGIGVASFVAVPLIADLVAHEQTGNWNAFALAITIEQSRRWERNPQLPAWMADDYADAWRKLFEAGLAALPGAEDENLICCIMAVFAIQKRQPLLARMSMLSEAERADMLTEAGWG